MVRPRFIPLFFFISEKMSMHLAYLISFIAGTFDQRWNSRAIMALAPFRAKVEERAANAAAAAAGPDEAPAKRPCTQLDQKINKLATGDMSLVKDIQSDISIKFRKCLSYQMAGRYDIPNR